MPDLHQALFYKSLKDNAVQCGLCKRACVVSDKGAGQCGVRKNVGGKLHSLVYGKTITSSIDPIEKKPLFHFRPGTQCLGVSTFGCNFFCKHCQNWEISQQRTEQAIAKVPFTSPEEIVKQALVAGIEGIAYTYTEPTIFAEYALDTMKLAHKKGLYNVWVSNGYMGKECIDEVAPFLDAINIDLKGNARFYKEVCGNAKIDFVKENISAFYKKGVHLEVTNLIVPGFNNSEKDFKEVSNFIKSIDKNIPLHFTRFSPLYKMSHLPPTDIEKLHAAERIAKETGLKYVYIGNVAEEENTLCPECGVVLIKRAGFAAEVAGLKKNGACAKCGCSTGIII
jgi:pyruvate formate lyase activating enzyme